MIINTNSPKTVEALATIGRFSAGLGVSYPSIMQTKSGHGMWITPGIFHIVWWNGKSKRFSLGVRLFGFGIDFIVKIDRCDSKNKPL